MNPAVRRGRTAGFLLVGEYTSKGLVFPDGGQRPGMQEWWAQPKSGSISARSSGVQSILRAPKSPNWDIAEGGLQRRDKIL